MRFLKIVKAVLLILMLWSGTGLLSYGLDPARNIDQYNLETYTTEDGLPQSSVLSVVQTRDGYLWLATYEGIARFDEPPVVEAAMLLTPVAVLNGQDDAARFGGKEAQSAAGVPVGVSCRVCPRTPCAARREPSIVMR